jgi:hypothetical protein
LPFNNSFGMVFSPKNQRINFSLGSSTPAAAYSAYPLASLTGVFGGWRSAIHRYAHVWADYRANPTTCTRCVGQIGQ